MLGAGKDCFLYILASVVRSSTSCCDIHDDIFYQRKSVKISNGQEKKKKEKRCLLKASEWSWNWEWKPDYI